MVPPPSPVHLLPIHPQVPTEREERRNLALWLAWLNTDWETKGILPVSKIYQINLSAWTTDLGPTYVDCARHTPPEGKNQEWRVGKWIWMICSRTWRIESKIKQISFDHHPHSIPFFSLCGRIINGFKLYIPGFFFLLKKKRIFLSNYCHSFVSLLFWVVCRYHLHGILRSLPFFFFYDNSFSCSRSTSNSIRYDTRR